MAPSIEESRPTPGLRERKKAKTRAAIQRHALRLFREQGYEATTVEQISALAEVSPSTFFRYFPTKEDVVLFDAFDPVLISTFETQPAELTPIQAMRRAMDATYAAMSPEDLREQWVRGQLIFSAPDLRQRALDEILRSGQLFAEMVARRVGRPADDVHVRTLVGAVFGALMAASVAAASNPNADIHALMDESLRYLESGMPL